MENNDVKLPVVGIFMLTYNHERFIEQAIESVMMQQATFGYKLFIGEDKSTDNTRDICLRLKQKYPNRIELLLQEKNTGGTMNAHTLMQKVLASKSKYIAFLDGDDYWTDKLKLQKQVDILEANPDCSICFTSAQLLNESTGELRGYASDQIAIRTDLDTYLAKGLRVATCTALYRSGLLPDDMHLRFAKVLKGDWVHYVLLIEKGYAYFLNEVTAVYREHAAGLVKSTAGIVFGENSVFTVKLVRDYFYPKYQVQLNNVLTWTYFHLAFDYLDKLDFIGFLRSIRNAAQTGEKKTPSWYTAVSKRAARQIYYKLRS